MARRRMLAVAGAIACGVLALGVSACGDTKNELSEMTLKFSEKDSDAFGFVDNPPRTEVGEQGPQRLSNGDQLVFRTEMLDAAKKKVGDLDVSCTVTDAGSTGRFDQARNTCHATVTLPGGQLFLGVGGKPFAADTTRGAVTGGTGRYEGATGSFTSVGETNSQDTFHIYLPKK